MAEAVIFDCDGVLVDSEPSANAVLTALIRDLGLETTPEETMAAYMGRSWASCMGILERRLGVPPPADLHDRYRAAVEEVWRRELRPVPGIVAALDAIDLPACVASSGEHERMRLTLGLTGLLPRFEGRIFSATEVARGKPAPDLFLHAAARMGFEPARLAPAGALADAGGEVFDDMASLPELLAAG